MKCWWLKAVAALAIGSVSICPAHAIDVSATASPAEAHKDQNRGAVIPDVDNRDGAFHASGLTLSNPEDIIRREDYPADALQDNAQGVVAVMLKVDATGLLRDCTLVQSSGTQSLDALTCRLLKERAHFRIEALPDDSGQILRTMPMRLVWRIRQNSSLVTTPSSGAVDSVLVLCGIAGCMAWLIVVVFLPPVLTRRLVVLPVMFAIMIPGFTMLAMTDRFASFAPGTTAFLATIVFMPLSVGCYLLRRRLQLGRDGIEEHDWPIRLVLSLLVGALFFQSLIKLVNAGAEDLPVRLVPGVITQMYRTHGKGGGDYIMLAGPAAALSNTTTDGLFSVNGIDYYSSAVEDHVCIAVHTGRLHLEWWEIISCSRGH